MIQGGGVQIDTETKKVHCKVFDENSAAMDISKVHKSRPQKNTLMPNYFSRFW